MSNMGYCRFQNTVSDLQDCADALEQLSIDGQEEDGEVMVLSREELDAAKKLASVALNIVLQLADDGDLNLELLDSSHAGSKLGEVIAEYNREAQNARYDQRKRDEASEVDDATEGSK